MKQCTKCLLPETQETITFDKVGVCNVCTGQVTKNETIDWADRKRQLDALIAANRGKYDYDCIVPFSGGKDSTWTLYYLVKEYGIKPLVVRFDHGFMRPNLEENVKKIQRELGVDMISFTPSWHVVRKLMLQSFLEKGDFCWHCHTGIFSYPMWVALEKKVPLIFWGEPSAEYTAYFSYDQPEQVDETRFNRFVNLGISADDMYIRLGGAVEKRELKCFSYPPLKDLRALNYQSVCLGSYISWDVQKQSRIIMDELGWKGDQVENVPPQYNYEKIECYMQGVRDYIKYIKRGFSRPSHLAAIDLRNGRMTTDEAREMVSLYEGKRPPSLDIFLNFVGMTEAEFNEVAMSHVVSPWQFDPAQTNNGEKLADFDKWAKEGALSRDEAELALANWRSGQG
ncbi:MAG: N-acetyl sugar amidotransferase [Rhodobacteraceae bacterium]|jgi:N-acetyl sugar amidotransferase|nr:N-acetyl sugar amidotransferase [Paracoccaceae bacterium]